MHRDDRRDIVWVVSEHVGLDGPQQPPDLLSDRGEHFLRRRSARDKGRHPAQRRLFLGEPAQLGTRLRVRDRGRDQLGEPGQPRLSVRRQRLLAGKRHKHGAPQPPLDPDRHARRRAEPPVTGGGVTDCARDVAVVDPLRPARLVHQRVQVTSAERQPAAVRDRRGGARSGPRAGNCDRLLRVVPDQGRKVDFQQPPGFLRDRAEHLLRRRSARDQLRHAAQRGLLLGDPMVAGSSRRGIHHVGCTPSAVPVLKHPSAGGGGPSRPPWAGIWRAQQTAVRTSAPAAATLPRRQAPERVRRRLSHRAWLRLGHRGQPPRSQPTAKRPGS